MNGLSRGGILWTFLSSPILMKSLLLSFMTSVAPDGTFDERPFLVAFPTYACSRETLLEDLVELRWESFRGRATRVPEFLEEDEPAVREELLWRVWEFVPYSGEEFLVAADEFLFWVAEEEFLF